MLSAGMSKKRVAPGHQHDQHVGDIKVTERLRGEKAEKEEGQPGWPLGLSVVCSRLLETYC